MRRVVMLGMALVILLAAGASSGEARAGKTKPPGAEKRAAAPAPKPEVSPEAVAALLERVEKLEARVKELEARNAAPGEAIVAAAAQPGAPSTVGGIESATVAPNSTPATAPAAQDQGNTNAQAATHEHGGFPSMQIRGFADVDFGATNEHGTQSGFNLGQFVLHMASPLSSKVSFFGELSFTARPTGYVMEVERSVIRYDYNDYFKVSFGRYHTPINYWNTAFHHGLWLQTTISRPEMIQFGGRLLPVHFLGLLTEGSIPSGGLGLNYNVGIGNGREGLISRAGDDGDVNSNRAWLANVFVRPAAVRGLQIGGSVYRDKLSPTGGTEVRELITSAHFAFTRESPEIIAEFANVHHRSITTGSIFNSQAFYAQFAYRLPFQDNKWKPYYRFEYIQTPLSDPVLNISNLRMSTLGMRYDISTFAAIKTEWRNFRRNAGTPRINGIFLQTSFTF